MSFSREVKTELISVQPKNRREQLAELAGMVRFLGKWETDGFLVLRSENDAVLEKCFTLFRKAFNIELVVRTDEGRRLRSGKCRLLKDASVFRELQTAEEAAETDERLRRAFLRGAFLAGGSVSTPEKYYHLELVSAGEAEITLLQRVMRRMGLDAKVVRRKKDYVLYLKEGEQIVTMIGEMGASISFLNLESIRVMREMRGSVNRRVNCETANLNKTIISSVRQVEDIRLIESHGGLASLKPQLREMAEVRLKYPDVPLARLGQYLNPPIGKSGVNHRLKKLCEIANAFREI